MLVQISFFALAASAIISALMVIIQKNVVHSAMWLIVTLLSVGGIFLMQHAEFLFAVQIILYVGGITVLYLFVIMLVNLDATANQARFGRHWRLALVTALVLLGELGYGLYSSANPNGTPGLNLPQVASTLTAQGNTQQIGTALYQSYMLPVEIASVLLLVAMVGAVIMAKRKLD
jgi:NADH-quinone oxidoreductase subunit J